MFYKHDFLVYLYSAVNSVLMSIFAETKISILSIYKPLLTGRLSKTDTFFGHLGVC